MEFAEYLTADCPPKEAIPASGVLFRMARKFPLKPTEFVPYLVRKGPDQFRPEERCKAAGLSAYRNLNDALKAIEAAAALSPLSRKSVVVKATLDGEWGKILHTPNNGDSHHTWWVPKGKKPEEECIFELVVQP